LGTLIKRCTFSCCFGFTKRKSIISLHTVIFSFMLLTVLTANNVSFVAHGLTGITPASSSETSSPSDTSFSQSDSSSPTKVSVNHTVNDNTVSTVTSSVTDAMGNLDSGCPPTQHDLILPVPVGPQSLPIHGTNASEIIIGTPDQDIIDGSAGNDTIQGRESTDILCGGPGNDNLQGGTSPDIIFGQAGSDTLSGGFEDDYLNGGSGNDKLYGNEGDDILEGGSGSDYFNCGDGSDVVLDFHPAQGDTMTTDCETVFSH
jgi:Ca2+-binding RTX toxin-like protein